MARTAAPPQLLSLREAADRMAVSERFMRRLVAERRIRHFKVGHFLKFDAADIDAFIDAGRRDPIAR